MNRERSNQTDTPLLPTDRRALLAGIGGLAAGALLSGSRSAHAGSLTPPPGPVNSTFKTLTEVEPRLVVNAANTPGDATSVYRITQPGSYYLTRNIVGESGKHGIAIAASGVTLDLNGYELVGVPGMGNFDGVTTTASDLSNITVINGSVRNWGGAGVDLGSSSPKNCCVEGVLASGNASAGISVGIQCRVTNCMAFENNNFGISTSVGCTITNCLAYQNTHVGIITASGCTITNCSATDNGGIGIAASNGNVVANCAASQNGGTGMNAASGCTVSHCSAYFNESNGISCVSGSTVTGCASRGNTNDGIQCTSSCAILDNVCSSNGNSSGDGAGIHAFGGNNRIEGNNCIDADRGIDVDGAGNIIIRNTCSGNVTNWSIVAGNAYGPIVATPAGPAVNGNTAAAALNSTDPNANFTH